MSQCLESQYLSVSVSQCLVSQYLVSRVFVSSVSVSIVSVSSVSCFSVSVLHSPLDRGTAILQTFIVQSHCSNNVMWRFQADQRSAVYLQGNEKLYRNVFRIFKKTLSHYNNSLNLVQKHDNNISILVQLSQIFAVNIFCKISTKCSF